MTTLPVSERAFKVTRHSAHTYVRITPSIVLCLLSSPPASDCPPEECLAYLKNQYKELGEILDALEATEQPNKTSEGKPPTRNEQKEGESK